MRTVTRPSVTFATSSAQGCMTFVTSGCVGGSQEDITSSSACAAPTVRPIAETLAAISARSTLFFSFFMCVSHCWTLVSLKAAQNSRPSLRSMDRAPPPRMAKKSAAMPQNSGYSNPLAIQKKPLAAWN